MYNNYTKAYKNLINEEMTLDKAVDMIAKTIVSKRKEADKLAKNDPDTSTHMDSLADGLGIAYQIVTGKQFKG